jgi:hypothetical protein
MIQTSECSFKHEIKESQAHSQAERPEYPLTRPYCLRFSCCLTQEDVPASPAPSRDIGEESSLSEIFGIRNRKAFDDC